MPYPHSESEWTAGLAEEPGPMGPCLSLVANVVDHRPRDPEGRPVRGLGLYTGGTKVYVLGWFNGDGGERLKVLGRGRGGRALVQGIVARKWLTNWRVKAVYNPRVYVMLLTGPMLDGVLPGLSEADQGELVARACWYGRQARAERAADQRWVAGGFQEEYPTCTAHLAPGSGSVGPRP